MSAGSRNSVHPLPQQRVIVSGIQPTGVPHIGNLLGALFNWVKLQNEVANETHTAPGPSKLYFFIATLHALTVPQEASKLLEQQYNMIAALLAVGLDPKKCTIFNQSQVPAHPAMFWQLSCLTSMGRLERMTSWKSKAAATATEAETSSTPSSDDDDSASSSPSSLASPGLLMYPVLQAADILLYRATHVPVGEDQLQHLELTRTLARSASRVIAEATSSAQQQQKPYFPEPQPIVTPSPRIYSLRDPTSKMSKSDPDPNSCLLLTDSNAAITKKIKSAVTDGNRMLEYDPVERPGVSNLLTICAALENWKATAGGAGQTRLSHASSPVVSPQDIANRLNSQDPSGLGAGSKPLKELTTSLLIEVLEPIRERFVALSKDRAHLDRIMDDGLKSATSQADQVVATLLRARGVL